MKPFARLLAFSTIALVAAPLTTAGAVALAGCGGTVGPYTWVDELPATAHDSADFVIRDIDTVSVRVYNQDAVSTHERVRPDGKITVPIAGEILVRGKRPSEVAKEVEAKIKGTIQAPAVSVSIDQSAQVLIPVLGEVKNAGTFTIDSGASVMVALADAGGLSDYASTDRIFVLRKGLDHRVRFRLADLRAGDPRALAFGLQAGDIVVVE